MNISYWCLNLSCRIKRGCFWVAAISFVLMAGCTEEIPEVPHVLELRAIPKSITISDKYFYPKPFSIRAKYSDKTEKNISSRVSWISENSALLTINKKGELQKNADCLQKKCVVSLIATDAESGKSIRLTVNMSGKSQLTKEKIPAEKPSLDSEKVDVTPTLQAEIETEIENELPEQEVINNVQNLQFSPQVDSSVTSINASSRTSVKSNSRIQESIISQLNFKENRIDLFSGEIYQADVIALDAFDKPIISHNVSYECFVADEFNPNIIVMPGCRLIAVKPGEAKIGIRLNDENSSTVDSAGILEIQVNPIFINTSSDAFNHQVELAEDNAQIWVQVSGLDVSSYYQAKLSGNVAQGTRLHIYARPALQYPTCLNTLPRNFSSVACYFQVAENDVMIVVENLLHKSIEANLSLVPAKQDLFQNPMPLRQQSSVNLVIDNPVTAFIFANESGGNNKHYYIFDTENLSDQAVFIKLFDFSSSIRLSVNWSDGYCNEALMVNKTNEIVCRVPIDASGKLYIELDGNNGESGVLNGPAAAEGGTFYKLLVGLAE